MRLQDKHPLQDVEKRSDLADTWLIASKMLQCKMRDGQPVRLGKGEDSVRNDFASRQVKVQPWQATL